MFNVVEVLVWFSIVVIFDLVRMVLCRCLFNLGNFNLEVGLYRMWFFLVSYLKKVFIGIVWVCWLLVVLVIKGVKVLVLYDLLFIFFVFDVFFFSVGGDFYLCVLCVLVFW